jgi:hypothetical protein
LSRLTRFELEALARSSRNMALLFIMMWLLSEDTPPDAQIGDVDDDSLDDVRAWQ